MTPDNAQLLAYVFDLIAGIIFVAILIVTFRDLKMLKSQIKHEKRNQDLWFREQYERGRQPQNANLWKDTYILGLNERKFGNGK